MSTDLGVYIPWTFYFETSKKRKNFNVLLSGKYI